MIGATAQEIPCVIGGTIVRYCRALALCPILSWTSGKRGKKAAFRYPQGGAGNMLTELSIKKQPLPTSGANCRIARSRGFISFPSKYSIAASWAWATCLVSSSVQRRRPSSLVHRAEAKEPRRCRASSVGSSPSRLRSLLRGPQWVHEIKLDGFRMAARIYHGRAQLLSRTGLDWTDNIQASSRRSRT